MDGNKLIKITTPAQFAKMVEIMEKKPYLAKGYQKSLSKINVKQEWNEIADDLNSIGPPFRNGEAWMKVWGDFKFKLKKKLSHNKAESHATGGGYFKQFTLTPIEEAVVNLLDMRSVVSHKEPFGLKRPRCISPDPPVTNEENETTERSVTRDTSGDEKEEPNTSSSFKKIRNNKEKQKICLLQEQVKLQGELCTDLKKNLTEIERYTRKIFKIKEEKLKLYKAELKRKDDHRKSLLEIRKAELEIKQKNIELELLKNNL